MQKNIKLEICVYNAESCLKAQEAGADRVELCASMQEGGLTPSLSMIEFAHRRLGIDTMVMIRPRGGDFLYSDDEFESMKNDVEMCRRIGVSGVVFGILTPEGRVDAERNAILVKAAGNMQTCFHRAIDMCRDYCQAASDIASLNFTRVLTSGAKQNALQGADNIAKIKHILQGKVEVMAGSGVNPMNIKDIYLKSDADAFHFSAKTLKQSAMQFKNPDVSMGCNAGTDEYSMYTADKNQILQAVNVIKSLSVQ